MCKQIIIFSEYYEIYYHNKMEINFIDSANEVGKDILIVQKHDLKNYNN